MKATKNNPESPRRMLKAASVVVTGLLALTACGGNSSSTESNENAPSDGEKVIFSTGTEFPPMDFTDQETQELVGFDVDLGDAIGEVLDVQVEWQESQYSQFVSDLKTGRSQAIIGTMLDNKQYRDSGVNFVDYLKTGFQFLTSTEAAEEEGIKEIEDFCGETVSASRNSNYADEIDKWSDKNCPSASPIKVLKTDGSADGRLQLKQGRVLGVMQTSESVAYTVSESDGELKVVGDPITDDFYGVGILKDDTEFQEKISDAMGTLLEDGTYEKLLDKWNLSEQSLDQVTLNLEPVKN